MNQSSRTIPLRAVEVEDDFWKREMELVRREVIPYQWEALNDRVAGAAPSFCMRNFRVAGKITRARKQLGDKYEEKVWPLDTFETLPEDMEHMEERFYGFLFQDSDFSKWIEAVGYSLTQHPDEELEKIADGAIDIVCEAQQENGYLDTYYIINDMSRVFTNLRDNHELYCFGHLAEGAVAYYQATGKDKLLNAARRYGDYIYNCFGPGEEQKKGYPGHEIAEMALVRLYEATGEKKYLDLCNFFLDQRGTRPYYYDGEHPETVKKGHEEELRHSYNQAHLPVRQQDEAVGHAVRAVYLYSGMADAARINDDKEMYAACLRLWDNIVDKKMYITGGIGATHLGEAFSFNYDLPNDTAYSETCAAIGLVFFARRMLQIKADRRFGDVMERALYNTVLSGMALDGKSFFYVNPLEVFPKACHEDQRKFHAKPVRQKWFGCACCPPNIARLVSSLPAYAYTENEDTLFVHLYVGGTVEKAVKGENAVLRLNITTEMPWDGKTTFICENEAPVRAVLALRIPEWSENYSLKGEKTAEYADGYLYITGEWKKGDKVELELDMQPRLIQASGKVREDQGKAALLRGPFVYCMEEADNGAELHRLSVYGDGIPVAERKELHGSMVVQIRMPGRRQKDNLEAGTAKQASGLYRTLTPPVYEEKELVFIPYYAWANRGEGEMTVWVSYNFEKK